MKPKRMLNRDERTEEKLDLGVEPFRELAGECARGRPEGLEQSRVRYMKDQGVSKGRIGGPIWLWEYP